jgi:hypothetical protein
MRAAWARASGKRGARAQIRDAAEAILEGLAQRTDEIARLRRP